MNMSDMKVAAVVTGHTSSTWQSSHIKTTVTIRRFKGLKTSDLVNPGNHWHPGTIPLLARCLPHQSLLRHQQQQKQWLLTFLTCSAFNMKEHLHVTNFKQSLLSTSCRSDENKLHSNIMEHRRILFYVLSFSLKKMSEPNCMIFKFCLTNIWKLKDI